MNIILLKELVSKGDAKKISGFDNYFVTIDGEVISTNYRQKGIIRVMANCNGLKGRKIITLSNNGKPKTRPIHRLVAETFIPNPNNLPEVNHIDEDFTNNKVSNLEWITHIDNINHGTGIKRSCIKRSKKIIQMDSFNKIIKIWDSLNEAGRNGFEASAISLCINNIRNSHRGFKWKIFDSSEL